jgi:hypothetical protein
LPSYSIPYQSNLSYQTGNGDGIESITRDLGHTNLRSNKGNQGVGEAVDAQRGYITNENTLEAGLITKKECKCIRFLFKTQRYLISCKTELLNSRTKDGILSREEYALPTSGPIDKLNIVGFQSLPTSTRG